MNRDRQKGVTFLGWVIILAVIGVFAIALLRAGPLYLEYYKINAVMASLNKEFDGKNADKKAIRVYMAKRFNIEAINAIDSKDVVVTRAGEGNDVSINYDARAPFMGNLHFIVTFEKTVRVKK